MAIPSGSGTEVLSSSIIRALSNTATAFRWDGTTATTGTSTGADYDVPANHIITVLSITFCCTSADNELLSLWINDGSADVELFRNQTLNTSETFVFNDKLILLPGYFLRTQTSSAADVDCYCSYIDQNWED